MITLLQDTLVVQPRMNLYLEITGGQKCAKP